MNDKKIKITEAEGLYIGKLYYEYNSILSIIHYLVSSENPPKNNYLEIYNQEAEKRFLALEIAKTELIKKYCEENNIKSYNKYNIQFEEGYILFMGVIEKC